MFTIVCGVHADNVNLLGDNINAIKKNTEALTDASKDGLQVNRVCMYVCMYVCIMDGP
jgi:hypothetical protein